MIICNQCGSGVEEGMRFCVECGHEVAATAPLPRHAAPTVPMTATEVRRVDASPVGHSDNPANRKSIMIGLAVGGALFFLLVGGIATRFLFDRTNRTEMVTKSSVIAEPTTPLSTPQPVNRLPPKPTPARNIDLNHSTLRDEAVTVLNNWAAAVRAHDLEQHLSYYADTLDVYYRKQNVSINYVRSSRRPAFKRFTTLDIQLANIEVNIDPSGSFATAKFDKTFHFEGEKTISGAVQQKITLTRIGNGWRITGEEDLQIYRLDK
jgi:ketosteroid isomerase-like protein